MEQRRQLKRDYARRFDIVTHIINEWDPIGLFPGEDAPLDEYNAETAEIVALSYKLQQSIQSLAEGIYNVFAKWFGPDDVQMSECVIVADRILNALSTDEKLP
jgi:DNA repair ATPase RecN